MTLGLGMLNNVDKVQELGLVFDWEFFEMLVLVESGPCGLFGRMISVSSSTMVIGRMVEKLNVFEEIFLCFFIVRDHCA